MAHKNVGMCDIEKSKILWCPEMRDVVRLDTVSIFIEHFIWLAAFLYTGVAWTQRLAFKRKDTCTNLKEFHYCFSGGNKMIIYKILVQRGIALQISLLSDILPSWLQLFNPMSGWKEETNFQGIVVINI